MKKINRKIDWKHECRVMTGEVIGNFLVAVGTVNFASRLNVPMTGVTGVAMILNWLYGLPIGWMILLFNIPLILLCLRVLGRRFLLRSIRCMIVGSLMIDYVAPLFPSYGGDRILAALCCGALTGLGYGIIYRENSSSGGTDFLTVAIKSRFPHISMGLIEFAAAFVVLAVDAVIFNDIDGVILGLVINFIAAEVINRLLTGVNEGAVTFTITDHPADVVRMINDELDRGSTIIPASGGYSRQDRSMVMCVTSPKEVALLQREIEKIDPQSFSVQLPCSEIHGEGFRVFTIGQSDI
ncbi:MAG: YitT family protein [Lachnospiraceae bacterium]|nr:YitT family protein [Lachnospiraceae bacterium]